jgi:Flp pilus assembly protein TadD
MPKTVIVAWAFFAGAVATAALESEKQASVYGPEPAVTEPAITEPAITGNVVAESAEATARAALIDPDLREGQLQLHVGNTETAQAAFERALATDPENRTAMVGLGTACIGGGRYDKAIEVLARAAQLFPDDYVVKNNLAWMFATARDPRFRDGKRALDLAHEALLIAPGDYHVWSTLSEAYYVSGRYKNALRAAEEAVQVGRLQKVAANVLQDYIRQVERCRLAADAMSILE